MKVLKEWFWVIVMLITCVLKLNGVVWASIIFNVIVSVITFVSLLGLFSLVMCLINKENVDTSDIIKIDEQYKDRKDKMDLAFFVNTCIYGAMGVVLLRAGFMYAGVVNLILMGTISLMCKIVIDLNDYIHEIRQELFPEEEE